MKAAVMREIGRIAVEEVDRPQPGPGEVLVRLAATGICHTDLSALRGVLPVPLPVVLGHEGAGVVESVGPGVGSVAPGDHVVLSISYYCGCCQRCQSGEFTICPHGTSVGFSGRLPGGARRLRGSDTELNHFLIQSSFAEFAVVAEPCAVKIRRDAPLDAVCLLGCGASTGYGAVVRRAAVLPGARVLVVGAGGVGLSCLLTARAIGAGSVLVADVSEAALAFAGDLGADETLLLTGDSDLAALVRGRVPGGVDVAFDAVGSPGTTRASFDAVRNGGDVVVVGLADPAAEVAIPVRELLHEKRLTGTDHGSIKPAVDIPAAVDLLMAGSLPLDRLVTRRYGLTEIAQGLADMGRGVGRGIVVF